METSEENNNISTSMPKRETVYFHGPFTPRDSEIPLDDKPADSKSGENMEKDTSNEESNIENMYANVDKTKGRKETNGDSGNEGIHDEQDEECIMYENKDLYDTP